MIHKRQEINIPSQLVILQSFAMQIDINCRMKIKWGDNSEEFFESLQDLKDLVDENC